MMYFPIHNARPSLSLEIKYIRITPKKLKKKKKVLNIRYSDLN